MSFYFCIVRSNHSSHRFRAHLQPFSTYNLLYFEILNLVLEVLTPALIHNPVLLCFAPWTPLLLFWSVSPEIPTSTSSSKEEIQIKNTSLLFHTITQ